jgi:hypothetical protein
MARAERAPGRPQPMVIIAACSSSAHHLDLLSDRYSFSFKPAAQPYCSAVAAMLCRGPRAAKILSQWVKAERSYGTQGPGERPTPPRKLEALWTGMQVSTPARQTGLRVGPDYVPSCYETKQAGLGRTLLAAYTGTHHGHT